MKGNDNGIIAKKSGAYTLLVTINNRPDQLKAVLIAMFSTMEVMFLSDASVFLHHAVCFTLANFFFVRTPGNDDFLKWAVSKFYEFK